MAHRYHRRDDDGLWNRRTGDDDPDLSEMLGLLESYLGSVWFDSDWDDGVDIVDDSGTMRVASIESRPIHTQYTIDATSVPTSPAELLSPNGRRVMSFAGAQWLQGAGALATLLQGSAAYTELQVSIRSGGGTTVRWSLGLVAASPANQVWHYVAGTNVTNRFRNQAGASSQNTGAAVVNGAPIVNSNTYSGTDYDGWQNAVSETLSGSGANVRAPASLDLMAVGAGLSAGAAASFWIGTLSGLIIIPGVVAPADRVALEVLAGSYYGYPI